MTVPYTSLANPTRDSGSTKRIGGYEIDDKVLSSIKQASRQTGVDFGYLMAQAAQESSFQPTAQAASSSASGLYQFLESTWLKMVHEHGAEHGLSQFANQITEDSSGNLKVANPEAKRAILDLRKDPHVSAVLGAEFALSNKEELESQLNRKVGSTELYLAHFLGASGATRFLQAIDHNSAQSAASLMPQAAAANRAVFYDHDTGKPRTVGEVYAMFSKSIESKASAFAGSDAAAVEVASNKPVSSYSSLPSVQRAAYIEPGTASTGSISSGPSGISLMTLLTLATLSTPEKAYDGSDKSDTPASRAAANHAYRGF
jgi:hypothetical protein